MKIAIVTFFSVLALVFLLTTFLPSPSARQQAADESFSALEIDTGLQISLQRKLIFWTGTFLVLGFYTWLVFSGRARRLTDWLAGWTGGRWWLTLPLIAGFCFLMDRLLLFPLRVWGLENWRAWGMTDRGFGPWLLDYGKMLALSAGMGAVALFGLYFLIRRFPRAWWAMAAGLGSLFSIGVAFILPLWIAPLFNTFWPLEQENPQLAQRVQALAQRAGVPVEKVLVVDASRQGYHSNAYFTGFGASRRIVLYDNLLKKHPPDEVESVVAHEIGHWQHQHIVIGICLGTAGAFLGFYLLSLILRWAVHRPPFRLQSPGDPAGWPLIVLLVLLASWLVMPIENAISRHFERQADTASLELMGDPDVFISAERRLARENKSNVAPSPLSFWLFSTHPSTVQRIQRAKQWRQRIHSIYED